LFQSRVAQNQFARRFEAASFPAVFLAAGSGAFPAVCSAGDLASADVLPGAVAVAAGHSFAAAAPRTAMQPAR